MINLKNITDHDRNCLIGQRKIHTSQLCARIRKLLVHDHIKHVVKIDIIGNLFFILSSIVNFEFIEKPCIISKLVQLIMKVFHVV